MKITQICAIFVLLAGAVPVLAQGSVGSVGKTITDSEKTMRITVPESWKEDPELHSDANLQASNRAQECYVIILSDSKADFEDMTIQKHSETTRQSLLSSLTAPEVLGPSKMTINGRSAIQYEIRGSIDNLKVTYLHTTVDTPEHFHQILTWTLRSRFDKNKTVLQQVAMSFKELK